MGGLLKPVRKLFRKRTLKKIGIGLGVAAAAILTGGAIMGMASGVGPVAGMGAAVGKIGTALGIGSATAPAATAVAGGAAIPAAAGAAGAAPTVAAVAPTVAGAATPGAATLGSAAVPAASSGGLAAASSSLSSIPAATSATITAAGGTALDPGTQVAPLARATPQTPAAAASTPPGVTPLVPGGRAGGLSQPAAVNPIPNFGEAMQQIDFGGGASGDPTTGVGFGSGLLQTAQSAGDWWNRLPPIVQFSLLRGAEGAFAPTPRNAVDEQIRLEDRRRARNRAPVYQGGGFFG